MPDRLRGLLILAMMAAGCARVSDEWPDPWPDAAADPATETAADPGPDPGTDPVSDPGMDPDAADGHDPDPDPGSDPGTDPGTDPGSDPGVDCGSVTCGPGETCCFSSYCADLLTDAENCGSCGNDCTSGLRPEGDGCSGGACTCHGGSGCLGTDTSACCSSPSRCTDTLSDEENCGRCGRACGWGETCTAGGCYGP